MTRKERALVITCAALSLAYVALALSSAHADPGYASRERAANVVGAILFAILIISAVAYGPRYLAQQAEEAAKEVLEETPEQRAHNIAREARNERVRVIGLAAFLAIAVVYNCFFTPDAQYTRIRAELDRLKSNKLAAVENLVAGGRDLQTASFMVEMRIRKLSSDAERLWPETNAAKSIPRLPPNLAVH